MSVEYLIGYLITMTVGALALRWHFHNHPRNRRQSLQEARSSPR